MYSSAPWAYSRLSVLLRSTKAIAQMQESNADLVFVMIFSPAYYLVKSVSACP
jgi:hypothetical protein